ncbi:MAG TPA: ribosome maturation factor RimP [Vicinamibacterales bacterium]|nr:ribosome maturation factor RimP [Vicinamibacterales bacterium]
MASVPEDVLARLRAAAARIAAAYGLDIFDVQCRRESIGWVIRVILDRPTTGSAGSTGSGEESVSIDDCRRVSEDLSALLDVEDDLTAGIDRAYTLEVSSPGLDRPLRHEADYRRFAGRLAKIVTRIPVDGQSHFEGRLSGVDEGMVLVVQGKRVHRVPLDAISRARLAVEF